MASESHNLGRPTCLVVNLSERESQDLIINELFVGEKVRSGEDGHIWDNENKYYTCSVDVRVVTPAKLDQRDVSALILYIHEPLNQTHIDRIREVGRTISLEDIDTKLVVVKVMGHDDFKTQLNALALDHGMEIIDLSEDLGDNEDEDEAEASGIFAVTPQKRIIEALQTCPWPNMDTKPKGQPSSGPGNGESKASEMEDFEQLFAQFANFRDQGAKMSETDRKKHAENVVMSFWSAMGGDPEEIGDFVDSD
eukprot:maker-scaffold5_size1054832-snap-gene-0.13 protein:Tk04012 transcript:maker-scaffold5_size1054832-snap-gene-0.13-mRNA-1 annotation:"alpha- and gamma-adaptin-binding protein p34-like"